MLSNVVGETYQGACGAARKLGESCYSDKWGDHRSCVDGLFCDQPGAALLALQGLASGSPQD